jgi:hypothetical protein
MISFIKDKSFSKTFLRIIQKKNVYPVHKPSTVDYIMFNFDEFLFISKFVWRALLKKAAIYVVKKSWSGIAQRNK